MMRTNRLSPMLCCSCCVYCCVDSRNYSPIEMMMIPRSNEYSRSLWANTVIRFADADAAAGILASDNLIDCIDYAAAAAADLICLAKQQMTTAMRRLFAASNMVHT